MHILFVDDEQQILDGIERTLFHRMDDWEISVANGGEEAIEFLGEEEVDVLVTDMRMPGVDGAALLAHTHNHYPGIVRVALTGYADPEVMLGVVPLAHRYLSKPCPAKSLEQLLDEAAMLSTLVANPKLRHLAAGIQELPGTPALFAELTSALNDETRSLEDVAEVVERDPAVTAKLLHVVNSPFFGATTRATDVSQAVVRLGSETVRTLVLAMEAFRFGENKRLGPVCANEIQDRSVRAASAARTLMKGRPDAAAAFTAALLHDVGLLVLLNEDPEDFRELCTQLSASTDLYASERKARRASHADLGAYLLALWGLPTSVVDSVRSHHDFTASVNPTDVNAAVYLAVCFAESIEPNIEGLTELGLGELVARYERLLEMEKTP